MSRLRVQVGGVIATKGAWSNTLEFILSGAVTSQGMLQTIATAIHTALAASTPFKAGFCSDTTMVNAKLLHYPVNTGTANLIATSAGSPVTGSASPTVPPQVCVVASLRTNNAGRSSRGRAYVPYRGAFIATSGVTTGGAQPVVAAYISAIVTAVAGALATQSLTCSWVVWSPKLGVGTPITAVLVGSECDTIRHRNNNRVESYASYSPPAVMIESDDPDAVAFYNSFVNNTIHGVAGPLPGVLEDVAGVVIAATLVEGMDQNSQDE